MNIKLLNLHNLWISTQHLTFCCKTYKCPLIYNVWYSTNQTKKNMYRV